MKYRTVVLGVLATPLPMMLALVFSLMVFGSVPMDTLFVSFSYVFVSAAIWVLIMISKGILHLASWRSCRAHVMVMFFVTMIPMLFWDNGDLIPDTSFSYQVNDNSVQTMEFAIGGMVAMALLASVSAMSMWIFWRFFVRDRNQIVVDEQIL